MNLEVVHIDSSYIHPFADHFGNIFFILCDSSKCTDYFGRPDSHISIWYHPLLVQTIKYFVTLVQLLSSGDFPAPWSGLP